jgi:hypothetical protein
MYPPPKSDFKRVYLSSTKHPSSYFKMPSSLDDAGLIRPQVTVARLLPLLAKPPQAEAFQNKKSARGQAPAKAL